MQKKINTFLNDMYRFSNEGEYFTFFYKSKVHVMLNLTIASKKNNTYTYEYLCKLMSPKFTSRSTIQSILNDGVNRKFFEKNINKKDKRQKFYKLNNTTKKKLEMWIDRQKTIFS